ncbi:MAG TPA: hypothetical protein VIH35_01380 [Kiritimatiellia bacterium]
MHSKIAGLMVAAAVMAAVSDPASAGLFGKSKKEKKTSKAETNAVVMPPKAGMPVENANGAAAKPGVAMARRVHMKFTDETAEQAFLQITGERRRVQEDARVIARLIVEKKTEVALFQKQLQDEFSIQPEQNYQYDDDTDTVYLLKEKAGADTNAAAAVEDRFDKVEHRKLDEEGQGRFLRLVSAKQLANEELSILGLLQNEKEIEANTIHEQMVASYAITNDREYRYERATKTLFEMVPVPAGVKTSEGVTEAVGR